MKKIVFCFYIVFVSLAAIAQPSNDDCTGAIAITLSANGRACVNGSTATATATNWTTALCGQTTWSNDVWYSFVSTGTLDSITIIPTAGAGGAQQLGISVSYGTSCATASYAPSSCNIAATNGGRATVVQVGPVGTQFFIEVSSFVASGGFTLCVSSSNPPAPPGGTCATATGICDLNPFSLANTPTGSASFTPPCFTDPAASSIWYTFTAATAGTLAWQVTPTSSNTELDWALYDLTATGGCPSQTLTPTRCNFNYAGSVSAAIGMQPTSSTTCPTSALSFLASREYCPSLTTVANHTYAIFINNYDNNQSGWDFNWNGSTFQMPYALLNATPTQFCGSGGTVTFTNASAGGTSYDFSYGDGSAVVTNAVFPLNKTYNNPGNYIATLTMHTATGCDLIATKVITIDSNPHVHVDTVTICAGQTATLHSVVNPTNGTYVWSNAGGSGDTAKYTPAATQTYTLVYTNNGCTDSAKGQIIVNPKPNAGIDETVNCYSSDDATMAAVGSGTWTALSGNAGTSVIANPSSPTTTIGTFSAPGTYRYEWNVNGCLDTVVITVGSSCGCPNQPTLSLSSAAATICNRQTQTISGTFGGSATQVTASSTGDGTFSSTTANSSPFSLVYTPGALDRATGSATITITTDNPQGAPCVAKSRTFALTVNHADPGGNKTVVCYQTDQATMSATGSGTWTPLASNVGTMNIVTPNSPTTVVNNFSNGGAGVIYGMQWSSNGCLDTAYISVGNFCCSAQPDVVLNTTSGSVCRGQAQTISGTFTGLTTQITALTAGDGTFAASTAAASPFSFSYTAGAADIAAGSVQLKFVTNNPNGAPCRPDTAIYNLTIFRPDAGADQSVCVYEPATMAATGTGSWSAVAGNPGTSTIVNPVFASTVIQGFSAPGTYKYQWGNGTCVDTAQIVVKPIPVVLIANDTFCFGATAGLQTSGWNPAGGTFLWNTGGTQDSIAVDGLSIGDHFYSVTYTANGCAANAAGTITIRPLPGVTANDVRVCEGGTVNVIAAGNPSGGSYLWSEGSSTAQISVTPAISTTYGVTYTYQGCLANDTAQVVVDPNPIASIAVTPAICTALNGTAKVTTGIGTSPYHYVWNVSGAGDTDRLNGLSPGPLSVTVTDAHGCTTTATNNIAVNNVAVNIVLLNKKDIRCNGGSDGTITVDASPSGSYTYVWNTIPAQNTATASGLIAGNYSVSASDANGCSTSANINIVEPTALVLPPLIWINPVCFNQNDGTATANPSGGSGNYTYVWNTVPGQSTATAVNLLAGNYSVTVSDDSLCTVSGNVQLFNPTEFLAYITNTSDVTCYGLANGSATVSSSGGSGVINYQWSTSPQQTATTATNLTAGTYTVTATDDHFCQATSEATISVPDTLTVSLVVDQVHCNGASTGAASAYPVGGTPVYSYAWNNGGTTKDINALPAADYSVTVTDAHGCRATATMAVTQPAPILTVATSERPRCINSNDGTMTLTTTGGNPTFSYTLLLSGTAVQTNVQSPVTNLAGGVYQIITRDLYGCVDTIVYGVPIVPVNSFEVLVDTTSCYGKAYADGMIRIEPQNFFNGPFRFVLDNGAPQFEQDYFDLAAGTHTLTIIDSFGCDTTFNVLVPEALPGVVDVMPDDSTIQMGESLALNSSFSPYPASSITSYNWTPASGLSCSDCPNPVATPYQHQNTYRLTIVYNNGCVAYTDVNIFVENNEPFYIPNAFSPNGDGNNDVFTVYGSGIKTLGLRVFDRWGEKVFDSNGAPVAWDGIYKGNQLSPGVYTYTLKLTYLDDKVVTKNGSITLVR